MRTVAPARSSEIPWPDGTEVRGRPALLTARSSIVGGELGGGRSPRPSGNLVVVATGRVELGSEDALTSFGGSTEEVTVRNGEHKGVVSDCQSAFVTGFGGRTAAACQRFRVECGRRCQVRCSIWYGFLYRKVGINSSKAVQDNKKNSCTVK